MEETALTFRETSWFWLLLLLPVLLLLYWRAERLSRRTLSRFLGNRMVERLASSVSWTRRRLRLGLALGGLALVIVALAGPLLGRRTMQREVSGIDVILAIDTSKSMLAEDVQPNRLLRAKLSALDVVKGLRGNRVGVIAFAGGAFLQAPLTIDHGVVRQTIQELDSRIIPTGGTNLTDALDLAVEAFGEGERGSRALVFYTDGEEWDDNASKLATTAEQAGITLFTVGVGTQSGSPIRIRDIYGRGSYHTDRAGNVVHSKLDEGFLRKLADDAGGTYYNLAQTPDLAQRLLGQMEDLRKTTSDVTTTERLDRYQWPLAAGLLLLGLSYLVNERRRNPEQSAPQSRAAPGGSSRRSSGPLSAGRAAASRALLVAGCAVWLPQISSTPAQAAMKNPLEIAEQALEEGNFSEAYKLYQNFLEQHQETPVEDRVQFNSGVAAYRERQFENAIQAFSRSLLSDDRQLQEQSHYNLGNSLFRRGLNAEAEQNPQQAIQNLESAVEHYESTLELNSDNEPAAQNRQKALDKIEQLKQQQEQQPSRNQDQNQQEQENQQREQEQEQEQDQGQEQEQEQEQEPRDSQNAEEGERQDQPGESPEQSRDQPQEQGSDRQDPQDQQDEDGRQGDQEQEQQQENQDQSGGESRDEPREDSSQAGQEPNRQEEEQQQDEPPEQEESPGPADTGEETEDQERAEDFELREGEQEAGGEEQQPPANGQGPGQAAGVPVDPGEMTPAEARAMLEGLNDELQDVKLFEQRRRGRSLRDW